jgi:hypothetical protein
LGLLTEVEMGGGEVSRRRREVDSSAWERKEVGGEPGAPGTGSSHDGGLRSGEVAALDLGHGREGDVV